jgi:hypothetical protein
MLFELIGGFLLLSAGLHQHWGEWVIAKIGHHTGQHFSGKISLAILVALGEGFLLFGGSLVLSLIVNGFALWATVWKKKQEEAEKDGATAE